MRNAAKLVLDNARRVAAAARAFEEYDQRLAKVSTAKGVLAARAAEATAVRQQADGLMVSAEPRFDALQTALTTEVARLRRRRDDELTQKLAAARAKWDTEVQRLVSSGNWSHTNRSSVIVDARKAFQTIRQFAEGDFRRKRDLARAESTRQIDALAAPPAVYPCLDNVTEFLQRVATRKSAIENTSTALVVEDDRSAIPDPELNLPPVAEPKAPRIALDATFGETIVNGEAAKRMTATLKVTVDFGTGAVVGTFSGSGSGEIDAGCDSRLRYTYGHSGAVSGSVDDAGRVTIRIAPSGSSEARFVRAGTCKFKPGGTGPWSGKGTITGTVSKTGAATLASKWQVGKIGVSGQWSGAGG